MKRSGNKGTDVCKRHFKHQEEQLRMIACGASDAGKQGKTWGKNKTSNYVHKEKKQQGGTYFRGSGKTKEEI